MRETKSRQGGAEIEVTAAMLKAGVEALEREMVDVDAGYEWPYAERIVRSVLMSAMRALNKDRAACEELKFSKPADPLSGN